MALAELQASLAVTPARTLGTSAWQVPSALIGAMAEQVMVGTVVSVTVKVVEQEALFPAASVAVTVIVCMPRPTAVPAAGDCVRVMALAELQASLAVTPARALGTSAWQAPSALIGAMAEQVMVGTVVSLTVKVVEQEALFPAASVAVTVIVCMPRPTAVPAAGDCVRVMALAELQASLAVTPARTLGTSAWQVPSALIGAMAEQV